MQDSVDEFQTKRKYHLLSITRKKVMRIVAIFLIWAIFITYLCLPVSRMKGIEVYGNVFLTDSKVIDIANINPKTLRWDFSPDESIDLLNNYQFGNYSIIKKAKIKDSIFSPSLKIQENFPLGILNGEVLLSNGDKVSLINYENDVPSYYKDAVGHLPTLNIHDLSENSLNNFISNSSKISDGYIRLRKMSKILSIENVVIEASPEDEVYVYSFSEIKNACTYLINIKVSPSRVADKLTYDYYVEKTDEAINQAIESGNNEGVVTIDIDYVGSWNIVDITKIEITEE